MVLDHNVWRYAGWLAKNMKVCSETTSFRSRSWAALRERTEESLSGASFIESITASEKSLLTTGRQFCSQRLTFHGLARNFGLCACVNPVTKDSQLNTGSVHISLLVRLAQNSALRIPWHWAQERWVPLQCLFGRKAQVKPSVTSHFEKRKSNGSEILCNGNCLDAVYTNTLSQ